VNWKTSRLKILCSLLALLFAFAQAGAECLDPQWQPGEGLRGVDGQIRATVLWDRDGPDGEPPVLVVGGLFTVAGSTFAANIALWNGSTWEPLGAGARSAAEVSALAVLPDGNLAAAGSFVGTGGGFVNYIGRWDGTEWSSLGEGIEVAVGTGVRALAALPNGDLLAAGSFTTAGETAVTNLARWDGTGWSQVGGVLVPAVERVLVEPNGDLIVAGGFNSAGGVPAQGIARWDGSTWSALGTGISGMITALGRLSNGDIVAAGASIGTIGGSGNQVLRWDGSVWSGMIDGLSLVSPPSFYSFTLLPNGTLVGGGNFGYAGGAGIAWWDGAAWAGLGGGAPGFVYSMTLLPNGDLVAGGSFSLAGNVTALNLARWDGNVWNYYGSGFAGASQNSIRAFASLPNGDLIAGGAFTSAGQVEAQSIARWNGSSWSSFHSWENGSVNALLALPDGNLVAAG
jgi:hypothetical protein